MHFAHSQHAAGNKTTKFALVVAFHVLLGIGLVKTMNVRLIALPAVPAPVNLVPAIAPPVALPPPSVLPVMQLPAPAIVVPAVEVPLPAAPSQNTVATTTVSEPAPPTTLAATTAAPPTTHAASAPPAQVRMAALADGCAKPAYPAQAARNGDTGTVTLALLVGVDGRVTGSRIEHSSGFRDLDRAALAALTLCTFKPAMQGDVAQAGWALIAYQWTLE